MIKLYINPTILKIKFIAEDTIFPKNGILFNIFVINETMPTKPNIFNKIPTTLIIHLIILFSFFIWLIISADVNLPFSTLLTFFPALLIKSLNESPVCTANIVTAFQLLYLKDILTSPICGFASSKELVI